MVQKHWFENSSSTVTNAFQNVQSFLFLLIETCVLIKSLNSSHYLITYTLSWSSCNRLTVLLRNWSYNKCRLSNWKWKLWWLHIPCCIVSPYHKTCNNVDIQYLTFDCNAATFVENYQMNFNTNSKLVANVAKAIDCCMLILIFRIIKW